MGGLDGRVIVITRPAGEAGTLAGALRARGAEVVEAPSIEILPAEDTGPLDEAVSDLCEGGFAWVVFSSPRAVDAVCERMDALGYTRGMATMIAAVGPATAAALVEAGFHVHLVADPFTTDALAEQFPRGRGRVLLPRADIAPAGLEDRLAEKGWTAVRVVAYRTGMSASLPDEAAGALAEGRVDAIAFTSASTVRGFARLTGERGFPAVCIGPVTARAAREEGFLVAAIADPHTVEGLAAAVTRLLAGEDGATGVRILHVTESSHWEAMRKVGWYEDESLARDGFIHFSFPHQIAAVANAAFRGRTGLVLLEVDPDRLESRLVVESPEPGAPGFPHLYGRLNLDAVVGVHAFDEGPDGFEAPVIGGASR